MPSIPQQRRMELSSIRRCFITYRESNANTNSPTLYSSLHFNQRTRMGCDLQRLANSSQFTGFNPRTRMGCDLSPSGIGISTKVSIHAPAWGATTISAPYALFVHCFNPRTRMGCDTEISCICVRSWVSIHAPAWGATKWQTQGNLASVVSIHAPAWGATSDNVVRFGGIDVSIHAPAWGAT